MRVLIPGALRSYTQHAQAEASGATLAQVLADRTLSPAIKGFMVWSANPAATQIDGGRMREGLLRDDLFTVVADHFLTDTARFADIVLPATTQFEHVDVQFAWGHHYVMANNRAIAPMGEARSSGAIMRGLAAALGLDDPAFRQSDEEIAASTMPEGWSFPELLAAGWRKSPSPRPSPSSSTPASPSWGTSAYSPNASTPPATAAAG